MKKILLTLSLIAGIGFSSMAAGEGWQRKAPVSPERKQAVKTQADTEDGYIIFGYCKDYVAGLGQPGNIKAAIEIPASTAKEWVGDKLTKVRIGFGVARKSDVTIYVASSLQNLTESKAFIKQKVTLPVQDGWNEVTLENPYEITGERFFIGYEYANCVQGDYPIGVDDNVTYETLGDNIALDNQWDHIGFMYGNICIKAVIEGDNLPQNNVAVTDVYLPFTTKPNTDFNAVVNVKNQGSNAIYTITPEVMFNGRKVENFSAALDGEKLLPGETGVLNISGLKTDEELCNMPVSIKITTVNGVENECKEAIGADAYIASVETTVDPKVVVEEWTGTWCGFCPRGIVGMDYMKEKYPDDFIGIAVHSGNGSWEPMEVASFLPFLNKFAIVGYPGCTMNRSITFDPNQEYLEFYYNEFKKIPTYAEVVELKGEYAEEGDELDVSATVSFAGPVKDGNYSLSFIITEDNIGPYAQTNYFSGGAYGPMGGWEKYSKSYRWMFQEVARETSGCFGSAGSIPANVDANSPVTYSTTLPLENVTKLYDCSLVVLILDGNTGEVVNAGKVSLYETGVENVSNDSNVSITTSPGAILVEGEYATCRIYTSDGKTVANGSANLPAGIYIVSVVDSNGNIITKKLAVN